MSQTPDQTEGVECAVTSAQPEAQPFSPADPAGTKCREHLPWSVLVPKG